MSGWDNVVKFVPKPLFMRPTIIPAVIDWAHLVTLDYETFWDQDYTLSNMSTSEYVRDLRFKAHMVGLKIGNRKTRVVPHERIPAELRKIDWTQHDLLAHNTAFDGFIMSHHLGIVPRRYYDTLSMARGLFSNDIGASLDEVAEYLGKGNKIAGTLDRSKGVRTLGKALYKDMAVYCAQDVDLTIEIFKEMVAMTPASEIELIHLTMQMFCDPVLEVDIPRVEKELARELAEREALLLSIDVSDYPDKELKLAERALPDHEKRLLKAKKIVGSSERYANLLRAEGIEPPVKISPAWVKLGKEDRVLHADKKWAYAFAKDDADFIELPGRVDEWAKHLNRNKVADVKKLVALQERMQALIDVRIAVKSTTNITRAQRFLTAGANGMKLPVGYAYYRAHTGRFGGNNKMNMQNLKRGGELRLSILAPKGHQICVRDSGQIECVAHDTLVLTKVRGYVKIQNILLTDLLWDGSEWVRHDGVIMTGYKKVITYDGLSATSSHKVWRDDGTTCTFGEAQSENRQSLAIGSVCGQAVRFLDSAERADSGNGKSFADLSLRAMREFIQGRLDRSAEGEIDPVQKLRWESLEKFCRAWKAVRLDQCEMQYPDASELQDLWSAWDQVAVFLTEGIYPLDGDQSASSGLFECGDRSDRERRTLCSGESETIHPQGEWQQSTYDDLGILERREVSPFVFQGVKSRLRLLLGYDEQTGETRLDGGADLGAIQDSVQKSYVYDILNAGPRHRFTAAGRIVSNCRTNGWLWDQADLMDAFRLADAGLGRDAYCNFGDIIYGREITKADKMERFVAKVATLGLGFQMGAEKFQGTLAKGALGGPPVYFTLDECKKIVNAYRRKNHKIVAGWAKCTQIIEDMAAGRTGAWKCLSWEKERIWLPNGMALKYPNLKKGFNEDKGWDEWTYESKGVVKKIYSGLLNENIVQALARIIVCDQMLEVSKKYRVVMTTHDEAAAIVRTRSAPTCDRFMAKAFSTSPAWALDLPLYSEGGFDCRYSK